MRKRKQPPEDLSKFISSKRRKIDLDSDSQDDNYKPRRLKKKTKKRDELEDVIIYDASDAEEKERDSLGEASESEDKGREEASESLSSLSEDLGSQSSVDKTYDPENSRDGMVEDIVDKITQQIAKKRSKQIDDEDLEKLTTSEAHRLKKMVKQIQKELEDDEPNIVKILSTPMTGNDRKKMVQLYEIYKNTIENTPEHYDLRQRLIGMLRNYARTDVEETERIDKEIERISSTIPKTDVYELRRRIVNLDADDVIKAKLLEMYREMEETPSDTAQYRNLKDKLEWGVSLPYRKVSAVPIPTTPDEINPYCVEVRERLDKEVYGMDEIKEEMIALRVNQLTNPGAMSSLALEGPPGVGKTAICEAFAKSVGKPFERIALGGMRDPGVLVGSDNHYVGSKPSIILSFLKNMKIADGYVLLDEIDKIGDREGQSVQDALLHITDYTQNKEFKDTFLSEFPHDISKICFLYGMNDRTRIDPILRDRLTIVELEAYTSTQIKEIIKGYMFPKALARSGMTSEMCCIDDGACDAIIGMLSSYIKETGVRKVAEAVNKIVTRVNLLRMVTLRDGTLGKLKLAYTVPNFKLPFSIDGGAVKRLLKPPKSNVPSYIR